MKSNITIEDIKGLACENEYKDGYHIGLNGKDYVEYGLSIEREFGEEIYRRVIEKKPDLILELGTANGYSTCWFLLGILMNEKGSIVTVDWKDRQPKVWDQLRMDTNKLEFINKDSDEFLKDFNKKADMIFLDTNHRSEAVMKDLRKIIPILNFGSIVFIHDIYVEPEMWADVKTYGSDIFDFEEINKSCGLGIATYKGGVNDASLN